MASATWAEDEFGRKLDRCLNLTLVKLGGGLFLGSVFSLTFFKRKLWPVLVGSGIGLGMAYTACQEDLNTSLSQRKPKECKDCKGGCEKK